MEILFFYKGTYPAGMAMSKRLHLYCKGLMASGIIPRVVFPSSEKVEMWSSYQGIQYSTIKDPVPAGNYILQQFARFFAAFYYALYVFRASRYYKAVFVTGFGWFAGLLIISGARLRGVKVVFEVNENPYSPEGGRLDPVWLRKVRRQVLKLINYRLADGFIVISGALFELISGWKKKSASLIKIPILIDRADKREAGSKYEDLKPFVLHAGALSETKDGMTAVFEAFGKACRLTDKKLRFVLTINVMHPVLEQRLKNIIDEYELGERIIFLGMLSSGELDELRPGSTLAIVNKPSNWQNDYNFPTKLGELLLAGVPVIASSTGEMGICLDNMDTALVCEANDSDAMAENILYLLNNPEKAREIGLNGRRLAENEFDYLKYAETIADFFRKLIQ